MKTCEQQKPNSDSESRERSKFYVGVRIAGLNKTEPFDPDGMALRVGAEVVVETPQGEKWGVAASNKIVNFRKDLNKPLPRILRLATEDDREKQTNKELFEKRARQFCLDKIDKLKLKMNLSRVVHLPETRKIIFFFTAEGRVDFRELVKELAHFLKSKIEMKQVGVRDEARAITGQGMCGESLCCSTFLKDFAPVTVRMAKDQGLALNPSKISGVCGRLMCCLQYEHDNYKKLVKGLPKYNSRIETPEGPGRVVKNDILRQMVTVLLDDESFMTYHIDELKKDRP